MFDVINCEQVKFGDFYKKVGEYFGDNFVTLSGDKIFEKKNWKDAPGVYVIWKKDKVYYIGMTGKYNKKKESIGGGRLSKRIYRDTPYYIDCNNKKIFYNISKTKAEQYLLEIKKSEKTTYYYQNCIDMDEDLHIDCFIFPIQNPKLVPAYLEAILLQKYLACFDTLPDINREF